MPNVLPRLLKTYEFLNLSIAEHGDRLDGTALSRLETERDHTFLDILTHAADDVRVTVAQLSFILSNLDRLASDSSVLPAVKSACMRHLRSIEARLAERTSSIHLNRQHTDVARDDAMSLSGLDFSSLDLLPDRAGVLDRSYRYVFTNAANARFHGRPAHDFIGRLNPDIVGRRYFEQFSRARIDRALAGQNVSFIASHPLRDPAYLSAVTLSPVIDKGGAVVGVLIIARDVSHLPLPPEMNAYRPGL